MDITTKWSDTDLMKRALKAQGLRLPSPTELTFALNNGFLTPETPTLWARTENGEVIYDVKSRSYHAPTNSETAGCWGVK